MASNTKAQEAKEGTLGEHLNKVTDFMDTILDDFKYHMKQKNCSKTETSNCHDGTPTNSNRTKVSSAPIIDDHKSSLKSIYSSDAKKDSIKLLFEPKTKEKERIELAKLPITVNTKKGSDGKSISTNQGCIPNTAKNAKSTGESTKSQKYMKNLDTKNKTVRKMMGKQKIPSMKNCCYHLNTKNSCTINRSRNKPINKLNTDSFHLQMITDTIKQKNECVTQTSGRFNTPNESIKNSIRSASPKLYKPLKLNNKTQSISLDNSRTANVKRKNRIHKHSQSKSKCIDKSSSLPPPVTQKKSDVDQTQDTKHMKSVSNCIPATSKPPKLAFVNSDWKPIQPKKTENENEVKPENANIKQREITNSTAKQPAQAKASNQSANKPLVLKSLQLADIKTNLANIVKMQNEMVKQNETNKNNEMNKQNKENMNEDQVVKPVAVKQNIECPQPAKHIDEKNVFKQIVASIMKQESSIKSESEKKLMKHIPLLKALELCQTKDYVSRNKSNSIQSAKSSEMSRKVPSVNNQISTSGTNKNLTKPPIITAIKPLYPVRSTSPPVTTTRNSKTILSTVETITEFMNLVNKAKRERRTFTICGNWFPIRRALAERGWIEKIRLNVMNDRENWRKLETLSNVELVEGINNKEYGDKYRRVFLSKLLAGHQVDFYWDFMTNPFNAINDNIKRTLINRFPYGSTKSYATKAGLSKSLEEAHWACIEGYSNILFPRTYDLAYDEELKAFSQDFRLTAAISLLQWVIKRESEKNIILSTEGKVVPSVFNFATLQCQNYIKQQEHWDIDETISEPRDCEWEVFLEKYYNIIHQDEHFKDTGRTTIKFMLDQAKYVLNKIKKYWPHLKNDGIMNLWILKPHHGSRGCGIHVCRTLKYILDTIQARKDFKYVVQKYIERPLLIYNTKFDMRQWFLITCMPTLHIWLYRECYLRFSSQIYNLGKLHESIHLTNNSVQCKYKNCERSNKLPDQNMWHSDTFKQYLKDIGQPYAWNNIVYKGIKEALIGLFMLCQDKLITRINSFELCGADFMLTEDFRPYLIEVNSRPALHPTTTVTARMCPKVLEDVVRVTVDHARNPRASTGSFELIYRDNSHSTYIPQNTDGLAVTGVSYFTKYVNKLAEPQPQPQLPLLAPVPSVHKTAETIKKILNIDEHKVKKDVRNTLEKILSVIRTERDKNEAEDKEKSKQFRCMLSEFVDIISSKTKIN